MRETFTFRLGQDRHQFLMLVLLSLLQVGNRLKRDIHPWPSQPRKLTWVSQQNDDRSQTVPGLCPRIRLRAGTFDSSDEELHRTPRESSPGSNVLINILLQYSNPFLGAGGKILSTITGKAVFHQEISPRPTLHSQQLQISAPTSQPGSNQHRIFRD